MNCFVKNYKIKFAKYNCILYCMKNKLKFTNRIVASIDPTDPLIERLHAYILKTEYPLTIIVKKALKMYLDNEESK